MYRPMIDRRKIKFQQGVTLIGERSEVILGPDEIYKRIFSGQKVTSNQMFSNIRRYSPTGIRRNIPHIKENVQRYNSFVKERVKKA